MTAPRAMTAAVIGLLLRSQGEAAFLQRQRAQSRSGEACEKGGLGRQSLDHQRHEAERRLAHPAGHLPVSLGWEDDAGRLKA
jgi:hypothetical protein